MAISKLSVYDIHVHSTIEQIMKLVESQNKVIELMNQCEKSQLICEFDQLTGNLKIIENYKNKEDDTLYNDDLWKEAY